LKCNNRAWGTVAAGRDGGPTVLTYKRSTTSCDCTPKDAEDWYDEMVEAAQEDDDCARLLAPVEAHLHRITGSVPQKAPWWAA